MINQKSKLQYQDKIKEGLKGASKGYFPISREKLKEENKQLCDIVVDNSVGNSNFQLNMDSIYPNSKADLKIMWK